MAYVKETLCLLALVLMLAALASSASTEGRPHSLESGERPLMMTRRQMRKADGTPLIKKRKKLFRKKKVLPVMSSEEKVEEAEPLEATRRNLELPEEPMAVASAEGVVRKLRMRKKKNFVPSPVKVTTAPVKIGFMNKQEPEVIAFSKDVPHQQYSADPVEREEDEIMEDEDEFESEIQEKILDLDETDDEEDDETVLKVTKQPLKQKFKKLRRKKIAGQKQQQKQPSVPQFQHIQRQEDMTRLEDEESAKNRTKDESRFLSLFTIVSFKNEGCIATGGNNGTCYSSSDCTRLNGQAAGSCASGFGVCCLFSKTCGESTSTNCTYFQNAGFPSTFDNVGSCQLTINKCSPDVCQLRLDFDNFVLAQPEATDHVCQDDQFIVSGGAPIPAICGTNTGLHMYVDAGLASNSPCVLTAVTSGASFSRSFSIKVTQIECNSLSKASDGCLQYHTGVSGQIQSFNYNSGSGLQLSNTDYSICVRMERNFCGIQYSVCIDNVVTNPAQPTNPAVNTPPMSFSITGGNPTVGSVVGTNCQTDWITIPCATNTNDPTTQLGTPSTCVDRICGMVFNSVTTPANSPSVPVNSFMKPFNIFVHTDQLEGSRAPAQFNNRGFCLMYVQQPCTQTTGRK